MRVCQECNKDISKRQRHAEYCGSNCYMLSWKRKEIEDLKIDRWMIVGLNSSIEAMQEIHYRFK